MCSVGRHGELRHRRHVLAPGLDRRPQRQGVGPGDGAQQAVGAAHPGDHRAVAEADDEVHAHGDLAPHRLDHPHHLGVVLADGHAVDHLGHAVGGLELGLEHQGVAPVAAPHLVVRASPGAMRQ